MYRGLNRNRDWEIGVLFILTMVMGTVGKFVVRVGVINIFGFVLAFSSTSTCGRSLWVAFTWRLSAIADE